MIFRKHKIQISKDNEPNFLNFIFEVIVSQYQEDEMPQQQTKVTP